MNAPNSPKDLNRDKKGIYKTITGTLPTRLGLGEPVVLGRVVLSA